jgi:hypothetical protein
MCMNTYARSHPVARSFQSLRTRQPPTAEFGESLPTALITSLVPTGKNAGCHQMQSSEPYHGSQTRQTVTLYSFEKWILVVGNVTI